MIAELFKYILIIFLILIIIEITIYLFLKFKNFLLYKEKSRRDFLSPSYHKYLNRYESEKPLFKYLPIGLRYFNFEDEEISGRF